MKYLGNFVAKSVGCGVAAVLALSAQAQTKQGRASVQSVQGTAEASSGGGAYTALTEGATLEAGSVVRTGAGSEVRLFLAQNGPVVVPRADTVLGLDRLTYDTTGAEVVIDTRLDLKAGRVTGHVRKMAAASTYEVKVPNGSVKIKATEARGTDYDIEVSGNTTVVNGTATLVFNNVTYNVNSGQTFDPTIPGVRPATPPEIDETKVGPLPTAVPVAEVKPPEEFFVSPLTGAGALRRRDNGNGEQHNGE
jgi:hypothetical protein